MPRRHRLSTAGLTFHVVNRSARRLRLFDSALDYIAFVNVLTEASSRSDVALYAYCVMPNHWHLVIRAVTDGALSRCMHWLTTTHARRWHLARGSDGQGAVYQGRFRAIPIADDEHFLWVCRYVERNALRASLVSAAEDWPWSSLWSRDEGDAGWLTEWPVHRPAGWHAHVNMPQTAAEVEAIRSAMAKGEPLGGHAFRQEVDARFGRTNSRPRGREPRTRGVLIK
jgi:putative transposase